MPKFVTFIAKSGKYTYSVNADLVRFIAQNNEKPDSCLVHFADDQSLTIEMPAKAFIEIANS